MTSNVFPKSKRLVRFDPATKVVNGGVIKDIVDVIAQKYGFKVDLRVTHQWTIDLPNGTRLGSTGDVSLELLGDYSKPFYHREL